MGSASTAVKWIAGLLMTIVLITVVLNVFKPAADAGKESSKDTQGIIKELQEQTFLPYDNNEVSGSQVIGTLRKFETQGKDQTIGLYVETGRSGGTWYYSQFTGDQVVASSTTSLEKAVKSTDSQYINPSGRFDSNIERDSNGVIRAIKFVQKK